MLELNLDESDVMQDDKDNNKYIVPSKVFTRANILSFRKINEAPYNIASSKWIKNDFSYQHCMTEYNNLFFIVHCRPVRSLLYFSPELSTPFNTLIEATNELHPEHIEPKVFIDCMATHLTKVSAEVEITAAFSEEEAWLIENRHSHHLFCFVVQVKVPSASILSELSESEISKIRLAGTGIIHANANDEPFPRLKKGFEFRPSDLIDIKAMPWRSHHNSCKFNYDEGIIVDQFHISQHGVVQAQEEIPRMCIIL